MQRIREGLFIYILLQLPPVSPTALHPTHTHIHALQVKPGDCAKVKFLDDDSKKLEPPQKIGKLSQFFFIWLWKFKKEP